MIDYHVVFTDRAVTYRDDLSGHTRVYLHGDTHLRVKIGTRVTYYPWHTVVSVTEERPV